MTRTKDQIGPEIDSLADDLFAVSDFLLANPETASVMRPTAPRERPG